MLSLRVNDGTMALIGGSPSFITLIDIRTCDSLRNVSYSTLRAVLLDHFDPLFFISNHHGTLLLLVHG
jgi:hypothetical protein